MRISAASTACRTPRTTSVTTITRWRGSRSAHTPPNSSSATNGIVCAARTMPTSVGVPIRLTYSASATITSRSATVEPTCDSHSRRKSRWASTRRIPPSWWAVTVDELFDAWERAWSGRDPAAFAPLCDPEDVHYEDPLTPEPLESAEAIAAPRRSGCGRASRTRGCSGRARGWPTGDFAAAPMKLLGTHTAELEGLTPTHRFVIVHGVAYAELRDGRLHRDPRVLRPLRRRGAARRAAQAGHARRARAADAARLRAAPALAVGCRACRGTSSPASELSRGRARRAAATARGELKARPAGLARAGGPLGRADLREAVHAHARVASRSASSSSAATRSSCARRRCSSRAASRWATSPACSAATSPSIGLRTGSEEHLAELAEHAAVPVVNMLSPAAPPVPGAGRPDDAARGARRTCAAAGSPTSATATTSRARWRSSAGWPASRSPSPRRRATSSRRGSARGCVSEPAAAAEGAAAVYTDVWVSMSDDEATAAERRRELAPYRLDDALLDRAERRRLRAALPARAPGRGGHRRACSTASASASGTRRRTAATRRRRCSSCSSRPRVTGSRRG